MRGHYQPFLASTYTAVALMDKHGGHKYSDYSVFDEVLYDRKSVGTLRIRDICINNKFYIAPQDTLAELRAVVTTPCAAYVRVKNGFATLCDEVFIGENAFSRVCHSRYKGLDGETCRMLFPIRHDGAGKSVAERANI